MQIKALLFLYLERNLQMLREKKKISKLAKLSSDSYLPLDSYSRFYPISKVDL